MMLLLALQLDEAALLSLIGLLLAVGAKAIFWMRRLRQIEASVDILIEQGSPIVWDDSHRRLRSSIPPSQLRELRELRGRWRDVDRPPDREDTPRRGLPFPPPPPPPAGGPPRRRRSTR